MKINRIISISALTLLLAMASCLKNDIPYPKILVAFTSMTVDKQASSPVIDEKAQSVTIALAEQADICNVKITDYSLTEGGSISDDITRGLDLSSPVRVTLSLYQDYTWTIRAKQEIERYFSVAGEVGNSIIDVPAKRVVAYVPKGSRLNAISIEKAKLGAADVSTTTPALEGYTFDLSSPMKVTVTAHGRSEEWTIYVQESQTDVELTSADAWTRVIWAYANAQEGKDNGFEYRVSGASEWTKVDKSEIEVNGGSFSTCIKHLQPGTAYEVRAFSDNAPSNVASVTTDPEFTIPNLSFDEWWQDGKIWNPWAEGGTPFWGTGNKGATTLGSSNSYPSTDTYDGRAGYSAQLDTKFVGIGIVGKLAAGNLFTGDYVRTDGTNGVLNFGRQFTGRPTKLHVWVKHKAGNITHTSAEFENLKGRPDTATVYIALTNWKTQYEIRTNPKDRQLFDKNASYVIGFGELEVVNEVSSWTEYVIPIEYRSTSERPSFVHIVCSASKLGDYFTGADGTTLMVDGMKLEWDY